ncbi:choice-of-anchor G family protein [Antribacter gilvus]|uniref:choice-of-anchor G family protein n=1 Tax=Antribacter gilvus TaxID=2304675 RepID=UPI000F77345F|nr:choice-of-anchor G family protein [Antribacter gilvus]
MGRTYEKTRLRKTGGRRARRPVAALATAAMVAAGFWVPAAADIDNFPTDPSEAEGSVVEVELTGADLLAIAQSQSGYVSAPGTDTAAIEAELLGLPVNLGGVTIPLDQLIAFGQLGALSSSSTASSPDDAIAASGLIGADGGLSLDSAEADWGNATIDLLSLADAAGVAGLTDLAVDQLELQLGAFGAEVEAIDGVFQDPDGGVTGPGQYVAGDASLLVHSPVIEDAAATVFDIGGAVDTQVESMVNDNLGSVVTQLTALLSAVPGVPQPTVTVDSNMQQTLFDQVVGQPITSANQLGTLDLSTGTLQIHLEHLVEGNDPWMGGDDAGLNGLAPNTEIIDDTTYPQIAETVHELMQEATRIMIGAIENSLDAVTFSFRWQQDLGFGGIVDVTWSPSLASLVDGTYPPAVDNSTGIVGSTTGALLTTAINTLGAATAPLFQPLYDLIISDAGDAIFELLINDLKSGITSSIGAVLSPVFGVITQFLSLQVNHQETVECTMPDGTTAALAGVDVSALWLGVLPDGTGGAAGEVKLGNAGARVDACALAITPVLTVDPASVEAGGVTTVTGTGYTPDSTATVQLTDAAGAPVGAPVVVPTDATGSFTTPLTVPAGSTPGDYTVVGTDDTTGTPAEAPLTVVAAAITPVLTVDPTSVAPGECTVVSGTGYTPSSTVTVQLTDAAGNPVGAAVTATTDATGAFTVDLCVPADAVPGDFTVVGTDDTTGTPAEAPLTIVPAAITPVLTVDPATVEQGGTTTVTGSGYTPDSTVTVQLTDAAGNPVGAPISAPTDATGAFTTPLTVPADAAPGDFTVVGTDVTTGTPAEAPLTVVAATTPAITVDPTSVVPGACTVVTGSGYAPNSVVTIQLTDAAGAPVGAPVMVTTDGTGAFTTDLCVPTDAVPGDFAVVGTDETGGSAETPLTVVPAAITPVLTVDPAEVAPGQTTVVTGSGYTPDSTVTVQLTDAAGNPVGEPISAPTDATGAFTTPLTVPVDAVPGDFTVVGTDDTTGTPASAPLAVVPAAITPTLAVDPTVAEQGDTVTVTGAGYTPDSTVTVQLTDAAGNPVGEPISVPTDATGAFTTPLTVPADAVPGDFTVVGTDVATGTPAEAPLTVVVATNPVVTVDPTEVIPGDCTVVTGSGFAPNATVTVQLTDAAGNAVGDPVTVVTDGTGGFTTDLCVPPDAVPGDFTVVAEDETGDSAETPLAVVPADITPVVAVDPSEIVAGGTTIVTGTGYTPDSTVTVDVFDSSGALVMTFPDVPTDSAGVFTLVLFTEATDEPGEYTVMGTDDPTGTPAEDTFTILPAAVTPSLVVEPSTVEQGGTATVTGSAYTPDSTVTVQVIGATGVVVAEYPGVVTDAAGSFTLTLPVPTGWATGAYTVVGTDDTTGAPAQDDLTVVAPTLTPAVVVDPSTVEQGGTTIVTGTGYTPNSTVTVILTAPDGTIVGFFPAIPTFAEGGFTYPLTVPAGAVPGDYLVLGVDDLTGAGATAPLTVVLATSPAITVDPTEVEPGGTTTVTGTGYTPDSTVTIQLTDAAGNPLGGPVTVTTDGSGGFTTPLTVPVGTEPGDLTVVGTDDSTGEEATAPLAVVAAAITPTLSVDPAEAEVGEILTFTGARYTPDSTVTITIVQPSGVALFVPGVVTDSTGGFTITYGTADAEVGEHTVVGTDDTTGTAAQDTVTLVAVAEVRTITVDPAQVNPGGTTTVIGEFFTESSTVTLELVNPWGQTIHVLEDVPTDNVGEFMSALVVPGDTLPGTHEVVATDDTSGDVATADLAVVLQTEPEEICLQPATITADPTMVEPGGTTTVTGTGFTAGATVTVQLTDVEGNPLGEPVEVEAVGTAPGDLCGGFTVVITIPEGTEPGVVIIIATPDDGTEGDETPIAVCECPPGGCPELSSWFTHEERTVGQTQTFTATGFEPGEHVQSSVYSTPMTLPAIPADATGTVSWTFVVPATMEVGVHVGVATSLDTGMQTAAEFQVVAISAAPGGSGQGSGSGTGGAGGGSGGYSAPGGPLATTGGDAVAPLTAMGLLLLIGTALVLHARSVRSRRA